VTWRKGEKWSRRVREACAENPELVTRARRGDTKAKAELFEIVCPAERLARIGKQMMRSFAHRDADWMLDEYLATSAVELLGDLADDG
jgi:hypothetical protein